MLVAVNAFAAYIVYPVQGVPFEADTVFYRGDSVVTRASEIERCYAWSQLLDILLPDRSSLPRSDIVPMPGDKAVNTAPGIAPVKMEYRKTRPYIDWVYPGIAAVATGIFEINKSKDHFNKADRLESEGNDPSHERKLGEQQRGIGLALAFLGAATIVVAITPRNTVHPVFTYTSHCDWMTGIRYEVSILGIFN